MPKTHASKPSKKVQSPRAARAGSAKAASITRARRTGASTASPPKASAKPNGKSNGKASTKANGRGSAGGSRKAAPARRVNGRGKKAAPVPPQYGTATPHLIVSPCGEALSFYAKAFGAKPKMQMDGPDGLIMHAEMKIGDSIIMCSDELPMPGAGSRKSPKSAGATTGGVMLYVKDVDAFFERAVAAGAKAVMPPSDQFWGDRYGQLEDPFGHVWAVATHLQDMTPKQMKQAMARMEAAQMGAAQA